MTAEGPHAAEGTAFELEAELDKKTEDADGKNCPDFAVWAYLVNSIQVVFLIYGPRNEREDFLTYKNFDSVVTAIVVD